MSYKPSDKPTTLGETLYQMHLGQMGYNTGAGAANSNGLEMRRLQQKKEREERPRKSWWSTNTEDD